MAKFLDAIKNTGNKIDQKSNEIYNRPKKEIKYNNNIRKEINEDNFNLIGEDYEDDFTNINYNDYYDEVGIQPAQKPESFHHFILENQYKDLERSIRGLKDVWDKNNQKWVTKRKEIHCFTDEEAEDILRFSQSHLATDIKLSTISTQNFCKYMMLIYNQISFLFRRIAEYRYGRYGNYDIQGKMKEQNLKIMIELYNRIYANYSRAIQGAENKATHNSVRAQESLQSTDRDLTDPGRYT